MLQKTFTILAVLTLLFGGWAVGSAKADQCTAEQGQLFIDTGEYKKAIQEFTCIIDAQPTEVEGYRGRIEAELLLGQYSDAVHDYTHVTALVQPVHPDAETTILAGYDTRLAVAPDSIPALMGKSFAQWWFFSYTQAIHTLNHLLDLQPASVYGNLFLGSSRMLSNSNKAKGAVDLEYAISLAPQSPDVRYIVADAYTYGQPDPQRAFTEASLALNWGLNTPRVHAILATSYNAFGDQLSAASHIKTHIDLVTTDFLSTSPIAAGTTFNLDLVPGRTYEIPVPVNAGETLSIATSSKDYWDTILVLIAPDGAPVVGSDDANAYFAAFDWTAQVTGIYKLQVTFFESVITGELVVTRN
jgi:tetratricopeptide (TPR) repeat protein